MGNVYRVSSEGQSHQIQPVLCKNEDRELQRLLQYNPDLLPGDQINPHYPRRWLTIAREMPVRDPNTGKNRWNIDFLFADQSYMPTFIECKRFEDTGSRRTVVGQMMEYAANGHHYWKAAELRKHAEKFAALRGTTLEQVLIELAPDEGPDVNDYFDKLEENLKLSQLRLVFFMESAPEELKSIVEFCNKQMERSEVLLVEARQYDIDDTRIILPQLFGYTEEARLIKVNTLTERRHRDKQIWDRESFLADAEQRLTTDEIKTLDKLIEGCEALGYRINWGSGADVGSFKVQHEVMGLKTLLNITAAGRLEVYLGGLQSTDTLKAKAERLAMALESQLQLPLPDNKRQGYPVFAKEDWLSKADQLIHVLGQLVDGSILTGL